MPIGIPKVPYQMPGQPYSDWISIYDRLYRERIIFLGRGVNDGLANQIIAIMLYLDSEDPGKPIYLYINWMQQCLRIFGEKVKFFYKCWATFPS